MIAQQCPALHCHWICTTPIALIHLANAFVALISSESISSVTCYIAPITSTCCDNHTSVRCICINHVRVPLVPLLVPLDVNVYRTRRSLHQFTFEPVSSVTYHIAPITFACTTPSSLLIPSTIHYARHIALHFLLLPLHSLPPLAFTIHKHTYFYIMTIVPTCMPQVYV